MPDDHTSGSVDAGQQIAAIANQTGLPNTIKSKAQRFILRWLAGSIGHPYVQQIRDNLDTMEGRSRVNMMIAEEVGRQALADPAIVERAKARLLGDIFRKQENIEAIAKKAQDKIETGTDDAKTQELPTEEPSPDWINSFTREAECASSDELRERLAAILAGEIKKPGTFSRSTIRIIAELDQEILSNFQSLMAYRVGDRVIRETDWNTGVGFARGTMLEDAGLISGSSGFTHYSMKTDHNGNGFLIGQHYGMYFNSVADIEKQIGVFLFTKVGRELVSLLPQMDERVALRRAVDALDKNQVSRVIIGRLFPAPNETFHIAQDELVWLAPSPIASPA